MRTRLQHPGISIGRLNETVAQQIAILTDIGHPHPPGPADMCHGSGDACHVRMDCAILAQTQQTTRVRARDATLLRAAPGISPNQFLRASRPHSLCLLCQFALNVDQPNLNTTEKLTMRVGRRRGIGCPSVMLPIAMSIATCLATPPGPPCSSISREVEKPPACQSRLGRVSDHSGWTRYLGDVAATCRVQHVARPP